MIATIGLAILEIVCILAAFYVGHAAGYGRGWDDGIDLGRRMARPPRVPRDPMA